MEKEETNIADGICHFHKNGYCEVFSDTRCDGMKRNCSFFKTDHEYIVDLNRAVTLNRKKGNCAKCRYMGSPCKYIR